MVTRTTPGTGRMPSLSMALRDFFSARDCLPLPDSGVEVERGLRGGGLGSGAGAGRMSFFFLVQVQVERSGDGVGGKQERESRRQDLRLFSRPRLASCRNSVIELASGVFVKSRWMHRNERRSSERRCKSTLKPIFFFFSRHHHHHRRRRRRKNSKTHRRHPRHRTPSPKRRHRRRHCCQSPVEFSIGKKRSVLSRMEEETETSWQQQAIRLLLAFRNDHCFPAQQPPRVQQRCIRIIEGVHETSF